MNYKAKFCMGKHPHLEEHLTSDQAADSSKISMILVPSTTPMPNCGKAIDLISSSLFSPGESALVKSIVDSLLDNDEYLLWADYRSYVGCQDQISSLYRDTEWWTRKSILNVARYGYFFLIGLYSNTATRYGK
jgi:hypothetical protein